MLGAEAPPPKSELAAVYATLNVGSGTANLIHDRGLLRQVFEKYDADSNGQLDSCELTRLLHDVYEVGIEHSDAGDKWKVRARAQLESSWGLAVLADAVDELLRLRDANENGMLSWEEFSEALDVEERLHSERGRFWRLAPLCDVHVDFNRLANGPYFKLKVFIAGAFAGIMAKTVASPLSRLTILLQTGGITGAAKDPVGLARHIVRVEGVKGLFRGNAADILRQVPYSGVQYLLYEVCKEHVAPYDSSGSKVWTRMLCGGVAGSASIFLTYPLDLIRARLCVQTRGAERYRGIVHGLRHTAKEEGVLGLYKGCGTAVAERFPNMAINFAAYDYLRQTFAAAGYEGLGPSMVCGCAAGWTSTVVTFPADVVMRNLQVSGARGEQHSGPAACAKALWLRGGAAAFYKGLTPQLAKAIPYSTTAWAAYDLMRRLLHFEVK
eukprot:TRINITY_DN42887_c0_g1_i1.p1 TRINITY_DN42887_c0_g1~~TRINITY_DN42887_c0_g1_i1.p1  ORF type:complete len:456 (+),score=140.56 TRINITY_DN42887_c0_g1_i1:54-1370(+)